MTDCLLRFRDVTGGLQDGLRQSPFAASVPEPSVDFSGAPNLCARFKQSLALRSKFAEKSFLLALALPKDWSSRHRSFLTSFAQWAEKRHCLKYSSGLYFVVLCWQAARARQRRVGGSLSACACSSASESFVASVLARYGPPRNESMLAAAFFAPEPWQRTLAKVHVRRCGPTCDEGEQVVSPEIVGFGRVEGDSAAEPQNSRRRRMHIR